MSAQKRRTLNGWWLVGLAVTAVLAYQWVATHPVAAGLLVATLAAAGIGFATVRVKVRVVRASWRLGGAVDPHRMSPGEFEEFLADLCLRDGCTHVQVVGGANDHGADVLYVDPKGRPGMIQAKRYAPGNTVGNEHVQIVNGTYRDAHGCQHAAIVTTSHFTQPAQAFAKRVGIALVDDQRLDRWVRGQRAAAPWN